MQNRPLHLQFALVGNIFTWTVSIFFAIFAPPIGVPLFIIVGIFYFLATVLNPDFWENVRIWIKAIPIFMFLIFVIYVIITIMGV